MANQKCAWIGIDVSQSKLDVCWWPEAKFGQYDNTIEGIEQLVVDLQPTRPKLIVLEATGGLERLVLSACQAADMPIARVNPRQVKGFAQALGKAKTDRLDAQMLAQYAERLQPPPQAGVSEPEQTLIDWVRRRRQLVGMQVAEKNRHRRAAASIEADIQAHIDELEALIQFQAQLEKHQLVKLRIAPVQTQHQPGTPRDTKRDNTFIGYRIYATLERKPAFS